MIARLLRNSLGLYAFSSAPLRKVGKVAVANLPNIQFPTKPKPVEDERLSMNVIYETTNYLRKDKLPNCRYYALEYKNRIYHFYNAYYYPLGRMMNRVATAIRGRNSPHYQNQMAQVKEGDICVIVNIEDPLVTGKKLLFKKLRYHTGFVGHLKEYSYRHVLNHKPELLYHYLLRKLMPKNKLSEKYLANLVLCRGPTHNFSQFPQFAPDRKVYSMLPQTDLLEMIKNDKNIEVIEESTPGLSEQLLHKKPTQYVSERDRLEQQRESDQFIEDLNQIHEDLPQYKKIPTITQKEYEVLKRKEKKIEERYMAIRAPYKKSKKEAEDKLKVYRSEKKARKDPNYELLKNEQLEEIDEENTAPNVHVVGGAVQSDIDQKK